MQNKRVAPFFNDEKGILEFLLVGVDTWDDFDAILQFLAEREGIWSVEVIDGIWFRVGKLIKRGIVFELVFHEDVGNYLFCCHQDPGDNEWLKKLAERIISDLYTS